jgi:U3 small nucleolar RNA-associated protein 12
MLMDALDLVEKELADIAERNLSFLNKNKGKKQGEKQEEKAPSGPKNPIMLGLSPYKYLARCLRQVKAPDLEQALLVMPFHYVSRLVPILLQVPHPSCSACCHDVFKIQA